MEALDTYLRLLHPIMPFVTEQLWQALPHRADGPGPPDRRPLAGRGRARRRGGGGQVGALVDLVRAVRNARADAKLEPAAWLPLDVYVEPEPRHARSRRCGRRLERLAHVQAAPPPPDARGPARDGGGRPAGWPSSSGRSRRSWGPGSQIPAPAEADRARLEKELADAERLLDAARARLANEAFTAKAPPAIVEGARAREAELADQVDRLRERLGR